MPTNPQDSVVIDDQHPSVRLGRMESDIAGIKTNISEIRDDLRATNARLDLFVEKTDMANVRSELADVRVDLRREIGEVRVDLRREISDVRADLRREIGDVRLDLRQLRSKVDYLLYWMIGSQAALLVVMAHGFKWV